MSLTNIELGCDMSAGCKQDCVTQRNLEASVCG